MDIWAKTPAREPSYDHLIAGICGVIFVTWSIKKRSFGFSDTFAANWAKHLQRKHRRANICGFLQYNVDSVYLLDRGVECLDADDVLNASMLAPVWAQNLSGELFDGKTLEMLCDSYGCPLPSSAFVNSLYLTEMIAKQQTPCIRLALLQQRLDRQISVY